MKKSHSKKPKVCRIKAMYVTYAKNDVLANPTISFQIEGQGNKRFTKGNLQRMSKDKVERISDFIGSIECDICNTNARFPYNEVD